MSEYLTLEKIVHRIRKAYDAGTLAAQSTDKLYMVWCRYAYTEAPGIHCAIGHVFSPATLNDLRDDGKLGTFASALLGKYIHAQGEARTALTELQKLHDDWLGSYHLHSSLSMERNKNAFVRALEGYERIVRDRKSST